jgi:hypothetical protein
MRDWTARRWGAAALGTLGVALLTGLPTVMVPNPVFTRMVPVTGWNRPVWIVTSVLAGLLLATYVRDDAGPVTESADTDPDGSADQLDAPSRRGSVAGVLSYLAIGCPVCNKLVVVALGTSGAMSWFAPLQPLLAVASIGLLAWALRTRLRTAAACPVPSSVP